MSHASSLLLIPTATTTPEHDGCSIVLSRTTRSSKRKRCDVERYTPIDTRRLIVWEPPIIEEHCWCLRSNVFVGKSRRIGLEGQSALVVGGGGVPRGGFVALLFGKWSTPESIIQHDYAFQVDDDQAIVPPEPIDVRAYPWAAANEPSEDEVANSAFMYWSSASSVIGTAPKGLKIVAYAIHACRDLAGGEEVTVHYGKSYQWMRDKKKYNVGATAPTKGLNISPEEYPASHLGMRVPESAYRIQ